MKKTINFLLSLIVVIVVTIVLFECSIRIVPFIYSSLPADKNNIYIFVLGESSAFGQPYSGKIQFSKILSYMLDNKINNKNIKLINFAEPGSRIIHQYFRYFVYKICHPFNKGMLLLYMGINDGLNYDDNISFKSVISKSIAMNLIILSICDRGDLRHDLYNDYEKVLVLAKHFGDDIFMSTLLGNYSGFMPQEVDILLENKKLYECITNIDNLIMNRKYDEALNLCIELKIENPHVLYRSAKIYEKQNKIKEAKEIYISMLDEYGDKRPNRYKNDAIRKLANKYNIEIVDTFNYLYNNNELIGYNFFVDKVHPNLRLHVIIAIQFAEFISKKYKFVFNKKVPTINELYNIFNFTKEDEFAVYRDALGEIFSFAYISEILDVYNIPIIRKYIDMMTEINNEINDGDNCRNFTLIACDVLLEYIQHNYDNVKEKLKKSNLLDNMEEVKMHRWNEKLKYYIYRNSNNV